MNDALRSHAPLVRKIARSLHRRLPANVELDDLVQVGMIALADAIRRHDPERGELAAFACKRIRGAMIDELRRGGWSGRATWRESSPVPLDDVAEQGLLLYAGEESDPVRHLERRQAIARADAEIARLAQRDRTALLMTLDGASGDAVGSALGVTRSRVSQILATIIERLRRRCALA